jgi:prephenate dehydrogenase
MELAERLALPDVFAGSHPLAGTHESGFGAAKPSRLDGALVYVTPLPNGEQAAREIADFWTSVCGAAPVLCDAGEHDRIVAWTSHLPQAVASALAGALRRGGPKGVTYGSGARDTTRLAASNPTLWHDVLLLNREALLEGLDAMEGELGHLRRALNTGNGDELLAWLEAGRAWRRQVDA